MATDHNRLFQKMTPQITSLIDSEIDNRLPTGTVESLSSGTGISLSPSPITISGTISLNADLNDLNGVSITNAVNDQILAYNGTSWINKAFPGLSGTSFSFVDLIDVDLSTLNTKNNNIIAVNSTGNALTTIPNNYINNILEGTGINSTNIDGESFRIELDHSTVVVDSDIGSQDYLIYHDINLGTRRAKVNDLKISLLKDDRNIYDRNNLLEGTAIDITHSGISTTIGVCTSDLPLNFDAGVSGILTISHGGTSAGTSEGARSNLGLVYNTHILPVAGPSFNGLMYGDNISLLPSSFGISLAKGGSGYTSGDSLVLINPENFALIDTGLSFTVSSGAVSGPVNTTFNIRNLDLLDYKATYSLSSTSGSGASFSVTPDPFYLFFGGSTRDTSVGLRDNNGYLEVKSSRTGEGASWRSIFPLTINGLCDVNTENVIQNDILIYDGTSFVNAQAAGNTMFDVSLIYNGTSAIFGISHKAGTIPVSSIEGGITLAEYQGLSGVSRNIQDQLDEKIGTSPGETNPVSGDLIYYNDNRWQVLRSDGLSSKILGISNPAGLPDYNYFVDYTAPGSCYQNNDSLVFVKSNEPTYTMNLPDMLKIGLSGTSLSGLDVDSVTNKLSISLDRLNSITTFNESDLILVHQDPYPRSITTNSFLTQLAGSGLSTNDNSIILNTEGISAIKLKNYTDGVSINNQAPATDHQNSLASVGSSLVFSNGTCWYYVSLTSTV